MSENLFLKGVAYFNDTENAEELLLQLSEDIHDDNIFSNVWLEKKMCPTVDFQNISKNFSTEILNEWNLMTYVLKERIPLNSMPIKLIELLAEKQWHRIWHSEDRASWYILIIKAMACTISQIYLVKKSTRFRQIYCPSSGVLILYSQQ